MKKTSLLALLLCVLLLHAFLPLSAAADNRSSTAATVVSFGVDGSDAFAVQPGGVRGLSSPHAQKITAQVHADRTSVVTAVLQELQGEGLRFVDQMLPRVQLLNDACNELARARLSQTTTPTAPAPAPTSSSASTPSTPSQGSGLPTADDNDITGFSPVAWSWTAEGEGYGRRYFTSGKYVRDDGRAVLYIESSDSPDGFSYQLFVMADGAKQSNYIAYDYEYDSYYVWASNESEGFARDYSNGLSFRNYGNGLTIIESDWIDEMYYAYGAPDGYYYLVREKK